MEQFKKKKVKLIFVTDLAARGMDLEFVHNIVNMDFP